MLTQDLIPYEKYLYQLPTTCAGWSGNCLVFSCNQSFPKGVTIVLGFTTKLMFTCLLLPFLRCYTLVVSLLELKRGCTTILSGTFISFVWLPLCWYPQFRKRYLCFVSWFYAIFNSPLCSFWIHNLPSYKETNNTLVILLNIKSSNNGKYIFVEFYNWKLKGPCLECLFLNQMYILNDLNGKQKSLFYWYSKFLLLKQNAFIKEEKTAYTPLWYS